MPKVTFVKDFKPKGSDPSIQAFKAGESYDLERSYADKYKRLGLATDYVEPKKPEPKADNVPEHFTPASGERVIPAGRRGPRQ